MARNMKDCTNQTTQNTQNTTNKKSTQKMTGMQKTTNGQN